MQFDTLTKLKREITGHHEQKRSSQKSHTLLPVQSSSDDSDNIQVLFSYNEKEYSLYPLKGLGEVRILKVACGTSHLLLLSARGDVYSAGSESDPSGKGHVQVTLPGPASAIACGPTSSSCITLEGEFFFWGKMGAKGAETVVSTPTHIGTPEPVAHVTMGNHFAVLVSRTGKRCFAWGSNAEYGLGLDDKSAYVAKTPEPLTFESLGAASVFHTVVSQGNVSTAITDAGEIYAWGGSKKEAKPFLIATAGLPDAKGIAGAAVSGTSLLVFTKESGQVYIKKQLRKGDWTRWDAVDACGGKIVGLEDIIFCTQKGSGKVFRYSHKSGEGVLLNTIRVCDVAASPSLSCVVLAVHNRKSRIFGSLHPEPLLKLATPKGMIEWLVKTGCKYESDLMAFSFAFPVILKQLQKENRGEGTRATKGLELFVKVLKKMYSSKDDQQTSRSGVNKLLQFWIDGRPPTADARAVLQLTQSFLTEGEQASLWKKENLRTMPSMLIRRMSQGGGASNQSTMEMEDVQAVPPKTVAATLTLLRYAQFTALASNDIVQFCLLTPDPAAFEEYPRVAEYVDFGNTLGRWAKSFVLQGGNKSLRGERLKWLFSLVQELELLRNFDLCFHFAGVFAWELMPDLAKQSKVDLDGMMEQVKKYGDRKFWTGQYQKFIGDQQSMIPLLVYHSNSISGGFGGSDSLVERPWGSKTVTYINISKFRAIGAQQQLLQSVSTWDQQYAQLLKGVSKDSDLYNFFSHVSAPSDAALTVMRSDIIPVSKHRESGKTSSFEQFSADVVASISAKERRVVKWQSLAEQLESDEEVVRMRQVPWLVCPRDAVLEGGLLGGIVKALLQSCNDIEWLSLEYWLLRRILGSLVSKNALEDIIISASTLWERACDSLPAEAEQLSATLVDFVARNQSMKPVIKAVKALERAAMKMVPELDANVKEFEETLKGLKDKGGALSRAQVLLTIGSTSGWEENNATVRRIKEKHTDMEESLKLVKAKLEHFGAQRSLMQACQTSSRDLAVLLDLWDVQQREQTYLAMQRPAEPQFSFFLVTHLGSKWGEGENTSFVHREPQAMRLKEFQEKLVGMYETVFGRDSVACVDMSSKSAPSLKSTTAYLYAALVRPGEGPGVFLLETPFSKEGSAEPWKKRMTYFVEQAVPKKRLQVLDNRTDLLSPIEASIDDIRTRSAVIRGECKKKVPDKATALILQQAMAPQTNTGLLKACAHLVDKTKHEESSNLSLAMWDFLLAVREGLAFFSSSSAEEDVRAHHILCKSFRELLALILPSLGPPENENFHYASLYQFVSLLLPQGFAQPLVDSPMVQRRMSRSSPRAARSPNFDGSPRPRSSSSATSSSSSSASSSARKSQKLAKDSPVSKESSRDSLLSSGSSSSLGVPVAERSIDSFPKSPFFSGKK